MRKRLIVRRTRWRERMHFLFFDADPAPVELLTAVLSLGIGLALLWPDSGQPDAPRPPWIWGLLALTAGTLKLLGVVNEWRPARMAGLIVGAGFWCAFAAIYGIPAETPIWVPYVTLAAAQAWALRRVVSP